MLLALLAWTARADSLVNLRRADLPSLPMAAQGLAAVNGRAAAFTADAVWLLDAAGQHWQRQAWSPPQAVQATATAAGESVLLLGANGQTQAAARLVLQQERLVTQALPALPLPLREARAALTAEQLWVAGLDAQGRSQLLQLPLQVADARWLVHPGRPGAAKPRAVFTQTRAVYVVEEGAPDRLWRWTAEAGWEARGALPGKLAGPWARASGQAHGLFIVEPLVGGAPRLMSWQTITQSWAELPDGALSGVAQALPWKDGWLWLDGAGKAATLEVEGGKLLLKPLDWVVIVVYLASMLGIGLYFYLREKRQSTAEFFVGGRSIPFWAAGVSLYAANTSSISYIAIPAKAFETNWQYMTNNLIAVGGLMFVAVWIVPLLRRLDLMSVFSYLETRFHPAIRMLSSGLFMLTQLGSRMSVILYLPSLAIATITGIPVTWSILMMGLFTICYTALGGMKAVVWTDIVQLVVKMGGALFAIGFIVWSLDGGVAEFVRTAAAENKTHTFDFSFDLGKATVWGFIFLVLFDVVLTFPKDQVLMQRTLSTRDAKEAGRSIWAFAAIMIPGGIVFYTIGTALFVFYKAHPERMNPLLSIDATFPLFIAAELPSGLTGLIIAGIFAAAMATLSSIINSVSTLASVDFYEKLVKDPDPARSVRFAEWMTVAAGLLGIGFALLLSRYDIHSLFDVSIELAGLLGGGFAGAYTLGMFTRRANSPGVAIGVATAIVLTTTAWSFSLLHPYLYLGMSIMLCIVVGYLASLFFPAPTRSLRGLTIYRQDAVE
ncbi:SSS family transporter [Pelomonas saccharophila]|uniref:SSS family transporter n=1 Tax=Roseateles saccharophilus TaxID=304 RepID=A0ABU1YVV6_ROSSA|nr:sodium:solute symporter [Roseateles saccharophilus]MDR7272987.1 SSS family transporter [Roseateles saccharophilus]